MALLLDPSRPTSVSAHGTRRGVLGQAKPDEVLSFVPRHTGHDRLTSNRHLLDALFPPPALVEGLNLSPRLGHPGSKGRLSRLRMPDRSHHHPPLCPALHRAAHFLAQGPGVLLALRDQLRLAVWPLPHNRDARSFTPPPGLKCLGTLALGQLDLRKRTQVTITRGGDEGARLTRRHLAVAHIPQPAPSHTRLHPSNTGYIEGGIGTCPRHHIRGQRPPSRIKNGLHDFDVRQIRAIILAVATLAEAPFRHRGIRPGAGAIDMHPCG